MGAFLGLALKSLLVAGAGLALLALLKRRSAAERSWVAHITLIVLLLLPVAPLVMPALHFQMPSAFASLATADPTLVAPVAAEAEPQAPPNLKVTDQRSGPEASPQAQASVDWAQFAYWTPALLLLLMTFLAVGRLVALRSRAEVLVEGRWLEALARAQRRMGFKHGTALLISDELSSPISWGLMRPVILLNTRAAEAVDEAEAIIAHELAHIARLDWIKLLLARVATAIFWFNPLVWVLAREAHQLREEAADDAVLEADIADTDYAQLLVGVARHECRGFLIGAHGVAPSKGSLARRVARVLDSKLARGPAPRSFAAGVFVGAAALAAPLAAVTLAPGPATESETRSSYYPGTGADVSPAVAKAVSSAVATSVAGAVAAAHPHGWTEDAEREFEKELERSIESAWDGRGPRLGTVFGPQGPVGPQGQVGPKTPVDLGIAMRAVGATPDYLRSIRAAAPNLGRVDDDDLLALKAIGVTPAYIHELASSGVRGLDADELLEARALGITGGYIRAMSGAGLSHLSIDDLVEMKAVAVTPADVQRLRSAGHRRVSVDDVVEFKTVGHVDNDPDLDDDPPDEDHEP